MTHFLSKEVHLPPLHMHTNLHQHLQIRFCALQLVSVPIDFFNSYEEITSEAPPVL